MFLRTLSQYEKQTNSFHPFLAFSFLVSLAAINPHPTPLIMRILRAAWKILRLPPMNQLISFPTPKVLLGASKSLQFSMSFMAAISLPTGTVKVRYGKARDDYGEPTLVLMCSFEDSDAIEGAAKQYAIDATDAGYGVVSVDHNTGGPMSAVSLMLAIRPSLSKSPMVEWIWNWLR